jgi:hypothetical protein
MISIWICVRFRWMEGEERLKGLGHHAQLHMNNFVEENIKYKDFACF